MLMRTESINKMTRSMSWDFVCNKFTTFKVIWCGIHWENLPRLFHWWNVYRKIIFEHHSPNISDVSVRHRQVISGNKLIHWIDTRDTNNSSIQDEWNRIIQFSTNITSMNFMAYMGCATLKLANREAMDQ